MSGGTFGGGWVAVEAEEPAAKRAYADIVVVLDRSGSMSAMKEGVVEGFNKYVEEMRRTPGDSRWTLVQFDDPSSAKGAGEAFPQTVYEGKGETEVPLLGTPWASGSPAMVPFAPRGATALVDALCTTIDRTQQRTSGQEVKNIVLVITDGEENRSTEFTSQQLRERIAATTARGWQYIYLGANQDSFAEARRYGVAATSYTGAGGQSLSSVPGLARGSTPVNNFVPTNAGIAQAICSGMVGIGAVVSGSIGCGAIVL